MLVEGTKEIMAILGLSVVGYIGSVILVEIGKKHLEPALNVVLSIAAGLIGFRFFIRGIRAMGTLLNIYF